SRAGARCGPARPAGGLEHAHDLGDPLQPPGGGVRPQRLRGAGCGRSRLHVLHLPGHGRSHQLLLAAAALEHREPAPVDQPELGRPRTGAAMREKSMTHGGSSGFTLVEALVAIVILVFGLIAIANLMIVASSSNSVARQATGAATIASLQLEQLKALPFNNAGLATGGDVA